MSKIVSELMQDYDKVSIVMAIFNPNVKWLEEQLKSINSQMYKNLELIIIDDCSTSLNMHELEKIIEKYVTEIPYELHKNIENLGSNKTFEKLTKLATGRYIAFCDQDDIWLPEKITLLVDLIKKTNSVMVCSDVYVIDGEGKLIRDSITKIRKRHMFNSGENLYKTLIYKNFVMGCTMLMESKIAKEAIPFIEEMVHDHYLALYSSTKGKIEVCNHNLIYYRIHGNNQTSVLAGVNSKEDYIEKNILLYQKRIIKIKERFKEIDLDDAYNWSCARVDYCQKKLLGGNKLWKLRKINKATTFFELIIMKSPDFIFKLAIKLIKNGKV